MAVSASKRMAANPRITPKRVELVTVDDSILNRAGRLV